MLLLLLLSKWSAWNWIYIENNDIFIQVGERINRWPGPELRYTVTTDVCVTRANDSKKSCAIWNTSATAIYTYISTLDCRNGRPDFYIFFFVIFFWFSFLFGFVFRYVMIFCIYFPSVWCISKLAVCVRVAIYTYYTLSLLLTMEENPKLRAHEYACSRHIY